jgi:hypothetical protein
MKDLLYQIGLQLLQNMFDAIKKYQIFGTGVLFFAIIAAMPKLIPKTLQDWWTWMQTALQAVLPIRQHDNLSQIAPQAPIVKSPSKEESDIPKLD